MSLGNTVIVHGAHNAISNVKSFVVEFKKLFKCTQHVTAFIHSLLSTVCPEAQEECYGVCESTTQPWPA